MSTPSGPRTAEILGRYWRLLPAEKAILCEMPWSVAVSSHADHMIRSEAKTDCTVLLSGYAFQYQNLKEGQRQILRVLMPGDFINLQNWYDRSTSYDVEALSLVEAASIPLPLFRAHCRLSPALSDILLNAAMSEIAALQDRLAGIGRKTAYERMANLICELATRGHRLGLFADDRCEVPLTQGEMSDMLGLTSVHFNRVIQGMRRNGLVSGMLHHLRIHDLEALCAIGEFKPNLPGGFQGDNLRPVA